MQSIMPASFDAEEALIGCILLNDKIFEEILFLLSEDDFYFNKHKIIFSAMIRCRLNGLSIDPVILLNDDEILKLKDIEIDFVYSNNDQYTVKK